MIATAEGKSITSGEVMAMVDSMGPQIQQFFSKDPREFVRQYALQQKLAGMAVNDKLDQQSPYKERLRYAQQSVLMQSLVERKMNETPITETDLQTQYDKVSPQSVQYLTKVLYVKFASDGKGRSEEDAKKKIDNLRKDAASGKDFVQLIQEHSEDPASKGKNGDYPPIKSSDSLPEPVKAAVLALKPGELTEPIRQANGFYLFRLEKVNTPPMESMKEQLTTQIRNERFNTWFQELRQSLEVKFENEGFFGPAPAAPPSLAAPKTRGAKP